MKLVILLLALNIWSPLALADQPGDGFTATVKNDEGEVLLSDRFGRTLYIFDLDKGATVSKCDGTCAEVWPPYLLTPAEAGTLKSPLGVVDRTNKKKQLTYNGEPVYTYALDRATGDDHGDGVGDVWHYIQIK